MKSIVLTGGTSGIGLETAKLLAKQGHTLHIVSRESQTNRAKVQKIIATSGNSRINFIACDLSDLDQVKELAVTLGKLPRIDVLMNNAGTDLPERQVNRQGLEKVFMVNYFAPVILTVSLLPKLISSAPARIVNTTSSVERNARLDLNDLQHVRFYNERDVYNSSKLALLLFTYELSRRLDPEVVTVNCFEPGFVRTGLFRNTRGLNKLVLKVLSKVMMVTPDVPAKTAAFLATDPGMSGKNGLCLHDLKLITTSAQSRDREFAGQLWEQTAEILDLQYKLKSLPHENQKTATI